ncbi:ABC transporter ATP-binding protein [Neptunitalea lumnitzerae]|uniref:ABC transporter ATP-binding protein n=1 Tax=Neptunitalea lumnitzerae TaxID=2965509 RepID=A0ABQ5ML18_9FLAO|nr:ABC transporter ATP-binding protein [Neptunitalea sp. Y10]GLB50047.1 ABC transporter ATP-binding protein [Neptunitalea sp. Y10]
MSTTTTYTLEANALSIGYTHKNEITTIAENLSFQLQKGELIGLVGANGMGKSTLLKTLCGMIPSLGGVVTFNGKQLKNYTEQNLAKELSIVLTGAIPPSNLTVSEIIALGRQPYTNWIGSLSKQDKAKVIEVIDLLKLSSLKHKKSYELSDGQLQKVLLGRALAQDTSVIVLDEPTTHLDIYHKAYILKLLKEVAHTTQKTILFSTHEIDLAIQLCDQMMILTKDNFTVDQPCNLISKGSFNDLFPKDLIHFDQTTGSFRVHK